jgi:hypothetical protein
MWQAIIRFYHSLYGDRGDDPVSFLVAFWVGTFYVIMHPVVSFKGFWSWFWEFNRLPDATPEHCLGLMVIKIFETLVSVAVYLFFLMLQVAVPVFIYAMIRRYLF